MNLRFWRCRLRLTQETMADLLSVPYHSYIKWERGERPTPAVVDAYADTLQWLEKEYPEAFDRITCSAINKGCTDD